MSSSTDLFPAPDIFANSDCFNITSLQTAKHIFFRFLVGGVMPIKAFSGNSSRELKSD